MTKKILTAALLVLALPSAALAQQLFDFTGQVNVPPLVGGNLTMYSLVFDPAPATTPIPLDFDNFEYTLVVTGLTYLGDVPPIQSYSGGTITLYCDNATAADYSNPATFTDGTALLSGTLYNVARQMFTATLGSATGFVDWTGGTQIGDLAPADRIGWPFLAGISRRADHIEPGYDEQWDGKVEPVEPVVATEARSWGDLKGKY